MKKKNYWHFVANRFKYYIICFMCWFTMFINYLLLIKCLIQAENMFSLYRWCNITNKHTDCTKQVSGPRVNIRKFSFPKSPIVNSTQVYPRGKNLGTSWVGEWVGPRASLLWRREKSSAAENWTLGRPAHSLVIDWLSYSGSQQPEGKAGWSVKLTTHLQLRSRTRVFMFAGNLTCITETQRMYRMLGTRGPHTTADYCATCSPVYTPIITSRVAYKRSTQLLRDSHFSLQLSEKNSFREKLIVS
jgi:hypothetical protein